MRLRRAPNFFELRLDAFHPFLSTADGRLCALGAPRIVTARHPREGGLGNLNAAERRRRLLQFLREAACVDVELRAAKAMAAVLREAESRVVRRIISVHAIEHAPALEQMRAWLAAAQAFTPDIFKIAVRTDTEAELHRLIEFFEHEKHSVPISAMGIGQLGRRSRIELARRGSALNYAHLGSARVAGQLSLRELRRLLGTDVAPSSRRA